MLELESHLRLAWCTGLGASPNKEGVSWRINWAHHHSFSISSTSQHALSSRIVLASIQPVSKMSQNQQTQKLPNSVYLIGKPGAPFPPISTVLTHRRRSTTHAQRGRRREEAPLRKGQRRLPRPAGGPELTAPSRPRGVVPNRRG